MHVSIWELSATSISSNLAVHLHESNKGEGGKYWNFFFSELSQRSLGSLALNLHVLDRKLRLGGCSPALPSSLADINYARDLVAAGSASGVEVAVPCCCSGWCTCWGLLSVLLVVRSQGRARQVTAHCGTWCELQGSWCYRVGAEQMGLIVTGSTIPVRAGCWQAIYNVLFTVWVCSLSMTSECSLATAFITAFLRAVNWKWSCGWALGVK